jgi:uncharacterized protein (DUF1330 family)
MKKGYWVVAYRAISDASAVRAYGALAVQVVQSIGGRFLTMSASQMQVHEAGLPQPTVLHIECHHPSASRGQTRLSVSLFLSKPSGRFRGPFCPLEPE